MTQVRNNLFKKGDSKMTSKSVMIYFPEAKNASNLRIIQDPTSQIRGFFFTKSQFSKIEKMDHANNSGIYFLFSELDEPSVYIGQSVNGIYRIKTHIREKEFWKYGILFVTDNNSFDRLSIDFLEHHFIQEFSKTEYILENRDLRSTKPIMSIFQEATLNSFANHLEFLLEALGISLQTTNESIETIIHYFAAPAGINARLCLKDGKYKLAANSIITKPAESSRDWSDDGKFYSRYTNHFHKLVASGSAELINNQEAKLLKDVEFTSPSTPAALCSGHSKNGWKFWVGLKELREKEEN